MALVYRPRVVGNASRGATVHKAARLLSTVVCKAAAAPRGEDEVNDMLRQMLNKLDGVLKTQAEMQNQLDGVLKTQAEMQNKLDGVQKTQNRMAVQMGSMMELQMR